MSKTTLTTLWVDGSTAVITVNQDGSQLRPYKTICQAMSAACSPTTRIAAGVYDEESVLPHPNVQRIITGGPVHLGTVIYNEAPDE